MTNKGKLIFVIVATVCAVFSVLVSTQFAVGIADLGLSAVVHALGLREAPPTLSALALAVLVTTGLCLYFAYRRRRHW